MGSAMGPQPFGIQLFAPTYWAVCGTLTALGLKRRPDT